MGFELSNIELELFATQPVIEIIRREKSIKNLLLMKKESQAPKMYCEIVDRYFINKSSLGYESNISIDYEEKMSFR
tara:strand:- start:337 stop:564 length:228 start_codon:yes stop_codon:yes gene_type:complete